MKSIELRTREPTPLYVRSIEAFLVLEKYEGSLEHNPTGTIKDRKISHLVELYLKKEIDQAPNWCCVTSGNVGVSLKHYIEIANREYGSNIRAAIFISDSSPPWVAEKLEGEFTTVVPTNLGEFVATEYELAATRRILGLPESALVYDVSDGKDTIGYLAYKKIAHEVMAQIGKGFRERKIEPPWPIFDAVLAPCGSGDLILGVKEGFDELGIDPRYYAATTTENRNPLSGAVERNDFKYIVTNFDSNTMLEGLKTPTTGEYFLSRLVPLFRKEGNRVMKIKDSQLDRSWAPPRRAPMEITSRVSIAALQQLAEEQGFVSGIMGKWDPEEQQIKTHYCIRDEGILMINSGCGFKSQDRIFNQDSDLPWA